MPRTSLMQDLNLQFTIKTTTTLSGRVNRVQQNLQALLEDPNLLAGLLRQAVIETVLVSYRERFLTRLPEAVATEREKGGPVARRSNAVNQLRKRLRAKLQDAFAMERGPARTKSLKEASQAYSEELRLYRRKPKSLPSGKFRTLAMKVLQLASDASVIKMIQANRDGVRLGIGSRAALERIQTPSATLKLTGHATTSKQKILWKHLEFGTGIYRSTTEPASRFRLPGGGWFFGESATYGLRLRGSKGVHALWDKQGRIYSEDRDALNRRFREILSQALFE